MRERKKKYNRVRMRSKRQREGASERIEERERRDLKRGRDKKRIRNDIFMIIIL